MYRSRSSFGFTLIELLIVVAISALFSTLAITYSSIGRNAVALSVQASKISGIILQAKELSIATYTSGSASCGYGVAINNAAETYSVFAYAPAGAPPCPNVTNIATISAGEEASSTEGTWQVPLGSGVVFQSESDSLQTVLFYPPNPDVFLSHDGSSFPVPATTLAVHLVTTDGKNNLTISVNPEGQVSF